MKSHQGRQALRGFYSDTARVKMCTLDPPVFRLHNVICLFVFHNSPVFANYEADMTWSRVMLPRSY